MKPIAAVAAALMLSAIPVAASAQQQSITTTTLAERRAAQLPAGALAFRIETYGSRADAEANASPTGLVAEMGDSVYLIALGALDGSVPGETELAEIGPLEPPRAAEYLLRMGELTGPPASAAAPHTHPGAESYYVVSGDLGVRTPADELHAGAGEWLAGPPGGTPIQPFNAGSSELRVLVMFVVDAGQPFSSPAMFPESTGALQVH
jgi:quercetin dioxygenase-like cupin family protein